MNIRKIWDNILDRYLKLNIDLIVYPIILFTLSLSIWNSSLYYFPLLSTLVVCLFKLIDYRIGLLSHDPGIPNKKLSLKDYLSFSIALILICSSFCLVCYATPTYKQLDIINQKINSVEKKCLQRSP